jgi:nitrogen-specific signal transduction histidine kinase/ActR/RegA family two-component response regulator
MWWAFTPSVLLPAGRSFSPSAGGRGSRTESAGWSTFFEMSADPMLVIDAANTILEANAAAARFFAAPIEKLKGASVLEIDLLARMLTAGSILQKLKTDQPPVLDEVSVSDTEGQPIQCRIQAIPAASGRTMLLLQDTSSMLRVRAALRSADQLHHAVFEALPEVAWTMALPEERLLEISPSVERLFGHQPAAFRQRPELWEELIHPADRERVRAEFRRGLATGHPFEIHFTGLHRDHRDLPYLVNRIVPVIDERGWVDRCEGFIEDQSSQRDLEEKLRWSAAELDHILDSVSSGVILVAPGESGVEVLRCNRRIADMLKLDEPVKPGTPIASVPDDLRALIRGSQTESDFERRILSDETRDEVAEIKDPHRVLARYAGPVRDRLGAVIGRIVTVDDVTSSWLLQRRLTHAQKMESMGRLAGGVAHDFNNLLGTVLGFSSLLLEQSREGDPNREALSQIVQSAERASRLTGALLAFSRSSRFERLPVHLNRVIEETYQLLRSTLDPSVAIELKLDPGLPPLLGDALLIQQILMNLVQEVRDRLSTGGSLYITTKTEQQARPADAPEAEPAAQHMVALEISVSAAKPGLRGARAGDSAPQLQPDLEGFAITIAEDIVRAHGGYLVSGAAAAPAVFRVLFPVNAPEEAPLLVPETATARGHETILVVDDEPGLRVLAKTGLQHRGFDVLTAETGEQALEILRGDQPHVDVVLLDLSMPGLSGERVLRAIRGFRPDLPVIIASGYATVESQTAWNAAGAQGFVAKPYRIQDLASKLREVLDRASGRVG